MLIVISAFLAGGASARELTGLQADSLARLAFERQVAHIPHRGGYSLDPYPPQYDPNYFHFEALGVWAPEGSAVLGRFAVNRRTAAVWDEYADCRRVTFPALRRMQRLYVRQFHLPGRDGGTLPRLC